MSEKSTIIWNRTLDIKIIQMKNIIIIVACFLLTSCFKDKDEDFYFTDFTIEFQAAVVNNNAVGKNYPIINALAGENKIQVNLIGGLMGVSQVVRAKIVEGETTAVAGEHYTLTQNGEVQFPAQTAISHLNINVPTLPNNTDVVLVVELQASETIKVSNNYKTLGLRIRN